MPVENPPQLVSQDERVLLYSTPSRRKLPPTRKPSHFILGCSGFLGIWVVLYLIWANFPYLSSGSDVVFRTKIRAERQHELFHALQSPQKKLLVFGTSKILAGFIPDQFDQAAAASGLALSSFNSGYPARDSFVPELKTMTDSGTVPDILLLTESWSRQSAPTFFHPIADDHLLADIVFPFRHLLRDGLSFIGNARQHG